MESPQILNDGEILQLDPTNGCKHYNRKCQLQCPTCLEIYTCRVCHDEIHYE